MSTNFPTNLDSYSDKTDSVDIVYAAHVNDLQDAVEALEAKVGIDGSAVGSSHDYKITNTLMPLAGGTFSGDVFFGANTVSGTGSVYCDDLYVSGDLGIGTASVSQELHIVGDVYIADESNNQILELNIDGGAATLRTTYIGAGPYPPLTFWTSGSEQVRIDTSGDVGIGTTNPSHLLHLYSDSGPIVNIDGPAETVKDIRFMTDESFRWLFRINATAESGSDVGSDLQIIPRTDAGGPKNTALFIKRSDGKVGINTTLPASLFSVQGNASIGNTYAQIAAPTDGIIIEGNVGIGTTTPAYKLDVDGTARISGDTLIYGDLTVSGTTFTTQHETVEITDNLLLINNGEVGPGVTVSGAIAGIEVDRGSETNYQFIFNENTDNFRVGEIGDLQAVATREDTPSASGISFWNSVESRFDTLSNLVVKDGNVGIGITNPTSRLHLPQENNAATPTLSFGDGDTGIYEYADDNLAVVTAASSDFYIGAGSIRGLNTGYFYINTNQVASATVPLFSFRDDINTGIGSAGADELSLITGGAEAIRIDSSGNVGIGATDPSAVLDVDSDILRLRDSKTPATASGTGNQGDVCWDSDYVYVCVAADTWKRSALASW